MIRIASFDIGRCNFAWYIQDISIKDVSDLYYRYHSLPKELQRRVKGTMNVSIQGILDDLYKYGRRVIMGVTNLSDGDNKWNIQSRLNLFSFLKDNKRILRTCNIFLIEQQYFNTYSGGGRKTNGGGANVDAIKIGENLLSWLLLNFKKETVIFPSMFKTHTLGATDSLTKPQRKRWSDEKAREILSLREDTIGIKQLTDTKKAKQKTDDICDALLQCQAYIFKFLIGDF